MNKLYIITAIKLVICLAAYSEGEPDPFLNNASKVSDNSLLSHASDLAGVKYYDPTKGLLNHDILFKSGERSLWKDNKSGRGLRISIKPTFAKPLIFKVYEDEKNNCIISVRRLSGLGGYSIGHVELIADIQIPQKDFDDLIKYANMKSIQNLAKLTLEQRQDMATHDGMTCSVEIFSRDEFAVIDVSRLQLDQDAKGISEFLTKQAISDLSILVSKVFVLAGFSGSGYLPSITK